MSLRVVDRSRYGALLLAGCIAPVACTSATSQVIDIERRSLVTRLDPRLLGTAPFEGDTLAVATTDGHQREHHRFRLERDLSELQIKSQEGETRMPLSAVERMEMTQRFQDRRAVAEVNHVNYNYLVSIGVLGAGFLLFGVVLAAL